MKQDLAQNVENLKSALLSLPATGEDGFEGLIGETLRGITGVPFRLARSGSQYGVDGKAAFEEDAICFECKRYSDRVSRNDIIEKLADLATHDSQAEIWVLGATSQVRSQDAGDARSLGHSLGIHVLILDWSSTSLAPLAVALAMAGTGVLEFLKTHTADHSLFRQAKAALDAVNSSPDFTSLADRIRAECDASSVGLALARKANEDFLADAFSSRKQAKLCFGQPLAPADKDNAGTRHRKALTDQLGSLLTASPNEGVIFVLGREGCGKSWVVGQTWLEQDPKPLMLFIPLSRFGVHIGEVNARDLLIRILVEQTGEDADPAVVQRWRRQFKRWQHDVLPDRPRFIIVLDGINQRPEVNWASVIFRFADEAGQLGGRVVVTDRTSDYQHRVEPRLVGSVTSTEVPVPEWTEVERDEILAESGIVASTLQPSVLASLRNPRILGIALELLSANEISKLGELTVSRLLFEHMRKCEKDSPEQPLATDFALQLQKHAEEFMSRVGDMQEDDPLVFGDAQAVADGRFIVTVEGDPTRLTLNPDCLPLALGFHVVHRLKAAKRTKRDLGETLATILEPIQPLDDTPAVVLAALTVACVDKRFGAGEMVAALVRGFAGLQNVDQGSFTAFAGLAKRRVLSYMDAAETLCLSGAFLPNLDWVREALVDASEDDERWQTMSVKVHSWLSAYSLSPERGVLSLPIRDHQEKRHGRIEKNRTRIKERVQLLSASERGILDTMNEVEGDLSKLSNLALLLLAGKPLTPFAHSLLRFRFSAALNPDHTTPYNEFSHLVSLNRVDWSQTREALLHECVSLRCADVSPAGRWVLVGVLRATGHSDDDKEAEALAEALTEGRPPFASWRRIETYCAVDPCDPASQKPQNVVQTARQYAAIDVSAVSVAMGPTREDQFFAMACPGIARFEPAVAIAKHRELIADVLERTDLPLRQGLFGLRTHAALLTGKHARALLKRRAELTSAHIADDLSDEDVWIVSQYHLLLAFPFLSAMEQAATLLAGKRDERFLQELFRIAKPLSEREFDKLLQVACTQDDERNQSLLLQLASYASVPVGLGARRRVSELMLSESSEVRAFALGVIAQSGDSELLDAVGRSGWAADGPENDAWFENWFGSIALMKAAVEGLISHSELVERISPRLYGRAAAMLGGSTAQGIARRIDASISHAVGLDNELVVPDIELKDDPSNAREPSLFTVNESAAEVEDLARMMNRISEDSKAFEQRQRHVHDAFLGFQADLWRKEASIVLADLGREGFAAITAAAPDLADRWYRLFMGIPDNRLPAVHNLVLWLANALGAEDPAKANELFRRVKDSRPLVRFPSAKAGVELDAMATWSGVRAPLLDSLRCARLDSATTDHNLALEVLAAHLCGQQELLATYVNGKLCKHEPAETARGIMVAGFSDQNEFNNGILLRYRDTAGLVGHAWSAAQYAYERNAWAQHWFKMMCQTDDREDFWRYSVLLAKIVDGRFDVWSKRFEQAGQPIRLLGSFLDKAIKRRIARWESHRSKTLFGSPAPAPAFTQAAESDVRS